MKNRRKIPNYPHPKPWYSNKLGEWRNITLYSIAGWFSAEYKTAFSNWTTAFGGYFKLATEDGSFIGEIVDIWGKAKIRGELENNVLNFSKIYIEKAYEFTHSNVIRYRFQKNGALWEGKFILTYEKPERRSIDYLCPDSSIFERDEGLKGIALCQITPVIQNAFGVLIGPIRYKE